MDLLLPSLIAATGALAGYLLGMRKGSSAQAQAAAQLIELEQLRQQLKAQTEKVLQLTSDLSRTEADYNNLAERLEEQKHELETLRAQFLEQFQKVSNQVLLQNAEHFQRSSSEKLEHLLQPLKERIKEFEEKVDTTYEKSLRENVTLKEQIAQLASLNKQMSQDAVNLTRALKGDSKAQGNWGEYLLESLLQKSGLEPDLHYRREEVRQDAEGRTFRPDVILLLPDDKHLIIDSKVSLVAYDAYCSCEDADEQTSQLQHHISSLKGHYTELGRKNYQQLHGIQSPDFVLMYIPIEPAFNLAMQHDRQLFLDALDRNVVLVTNSTLLATLRTVASVWRQENQKRNVLKIAEESGKLYDKFVGFLDDLREIGQHLERSQSKYATAMNKLVEGKGNLIRRVEHLRQLGARASKKVDESWLHQHLPEEVQEEQ